MIYKSTYESPLGPIYLASDDTSLIGLWLEGQTNFESIISEDIIEQDNLKIFCDTKTWLEEYFAGNQPSISNLNLAPRGSEFRQQVWKILCEIPYGQTTTYGEISKQIATIRGVEKMSAQAIGGAVGHNPISIIIPCHRVIGANGNLTGYAGGLDKKIWLLEHEGAV